MRFKGIVAIALTLMFVNGLSVEAKVNKMQGEKLSAAESMNYPAEYNAVSNDPRIWAAMDALKGTTGEYSLKAILGQNLSEKPIKVSFLNLASLNQNYATYDALGMKRKKQLFIYINEKHMEAPPEALGALLSHEALHQDEFNSSNEETYAWTMEARVWLEMCRRKTSLRKITDSSLVNRENILIKMLENADYSNRLIKGSVVNNPVYRGLPRSSPGFDMTD